MRVLRKNARKDGVRPLQFMKLPAELRNRIYGYVMVFRSRKTRLPVRITFTVGLMAKLHPEYALSKAYGAHAAKQPAITRVSRKLRHETLAMFYSLNHFQIRLGLSSMLAQDSRAQAIEEALAGNWEAHRWLQAIGTGNVELIKESTMSSNIQPHELHQIMETTNLGLLSKVTKFERL